jgi:hypothetical protein
MRIRPAIAACLLLACAAAPAAAADKFLGKYDDWEAHRIGTGRNVVCFAATLPAKSEGSPRKRGEATLMIANFPGHKAYGRIQVKAGVALKKGGEVKLEVGDKAFTLYAEGDSGFARTSDQHAAIVAALKAGRSARATAISAAGARMVDIYSLSGVTAAIGEIDKACGR